jgi:hypothetical protein
VTEQLSFEGVEVLKETKKPRIKEVKHDVIDDGLVYVNRALIAMIDATPKGYVLLHIGNQQIKVEKEKLRFL